MDDSSHNASNPPTEPPREIGGYRIQRVIGSGGMATVYAALQANPKRTVALKVMNAADHAPEALRRFRREAQNLARLRHPGIAQIYEAGTHTDEHGRAIPFFVMEYIPSAKNILEYANAKQLDRRQRLRLFVKVCAAVEHGHHQKIIHRDLKPANILIDQSGQPKIIDFGIARAAQLDLSHRAQEGDTNRLVGTIQYMAPEQLKGESIDLDGRCDVYALGAVLYRLLTGRPPHDVQGMPVHQARQTIREQPPKPPGALQRELRGDLIAIIEKTLAKERSQRYRHAGELGRDILRYLRDEPVQARSVSMMHRLRLLIRRHRAAVTAVIIVALVLGLAATFIVVSPYLSNQFRDTKDASRAPATDNAAVSSVATSKTSSQNPGESNATASSREPFPIATFASRINEIVSHPNGLVAIASNDASVSVYDLNKRTSRFTVQPDDEPVTHVAFNQAGDQLLTVTRRGLCVVLDAESGEIINTIKHPCEMINEAALSPSGEHMALSCEDFIVRLIDRHGPDRTLRSTTGDITALAFSSDGKRLLAGSNGDRLYLWNVETGRVQHRINALANGTIAVAWIENDQAILAVNQDGRAATWRLTDEDGAPQRDDETSELDVTDGRPVAVSVDPTGQWLAGASADAVMIVDLKNKEPLGEPRRHDGRLTATAITPDGRWYIIGALSGDVTAVPIETPNAMPAD